MKGAVQTVRSPLNFPGNVTPEIAQDIEDVIKEAQNLPTSYFEGKMYRAVPITEALAYVVPKNMDATLKQQLRDAGGNVIEYKSGDNADRLKKVNSVEGARFSVKGQMLDENNQGINNSKKLSEFQAMKMTDGRQVTSDFAEAMYKLSQGEHIAIDDLYNITEIAGGKAKLDQALENGASALLPGRETIQDKAYKIISDFGSWTGKNTRDREAHYGYNGDVRKDRRLDIVTGLPASGKSTAIVNDISQKYKSRLLDNDEIKKSWTAMIMAGVLDSFIKNRAQ